MTTEEISNLKNLFDACERAGDTMYWNNNGKYRTVANIRDISEGAHTITCAILLDGARVSVHNLSLDAFVNKLPVPNVPSPTFVDDHEEGYGIGDKMVTLCPKCDEPTDCVVDRLNHPEGWMDLVCDHGHKFSQQM